MLVIRRWTGLQMRPVRAKLVTVLGLRNGLQAGASARLPV
jgi:hypothetical protein